ncbi:hypothetical protein HD553DRAFT_353048 [Filobasidium floriforme]|uniref:uncharacterized protein n=1 Tax=Filobasidium floriforme TaxID=5210 RepID=UPI001E8E8D87|nr:uncharacterized protein HD553DRAFT_353048 [Filobasidium floriforme]KAH8078248.1 hypothetical protein HD553DRAFT_353048 [Filobasidium floriforme]
MHKFFVRERKYRAPVSTIGAVVFTALFSLSYTSWIEYRGLDGKFPYPFLPAASMPIRLAIYVGGTIFAYASFKVLNGLHK